MSHIPALQAAMRTAVTPAVLISSEINQRYLTGFAYTDGYVLVLPHTAYLLADFRYIEAAKATVDPATCQVIQPDRPMLSYLAAILRDEGVQTLAMEENTVSCALRDRLAAAFPGVTLTAGGSRLMDDLRLHKDEAEIAAITRAQAITDMAFAHILDFITPDRTEIEVALELEFFMRAHGSDGVAFETIAVSGTHSSRPHGTPRPVKLEPGFLTMDFGARVDGYCSDMTRTVVLGRADHDMKRLYNTVLLAQTTALGALHAGMPCAEADKIARDIIHNAGYEGCFGHSLGHGVGLYIHEEPRLAGSAPAESVLAPGHVVTVEPGIYLSGRYGCRIEDMVAIRPDGTVHNFTQSPKELIEIG